MSLGRGAGGALSLATGRLEVSAFPRCGCRVIKGAGLALRAWILYPLQNVWSAFMN